MRHALLKRPDGLKPGEARRLAALRSIRSALPMSTSGWPPLAK